MPHARWIGRIGLDAIEGRQRVQRWVRFEPQIGTDLAAGLDASDLMATEAAEFADQVVTVDYLGRFDPVAVADQVGHVVVAFQARRFEKAVREHRHVPIMVGLPAVFFVPAFLNDRVVGSVGGFEEGGAAALPGMADRAAEFLG